MNTATTLLIAVSIAASVSWTRDDTHEAIVRSAALYSVSQSEMDCMVRVESNFDPYAIGSQGELGAAQLHPQGALQDFYRRGYTDPFNPTQSMDYLAAEIAAGRGGKWTAYWRC